jgi:hypothetical protein
LTNENELKGIVERYVKAMNDLPGIVRSRSSEAAFVWFKLGELLYRAASLQVVQGSEAASAPSDSPELQALELLAERHELPRPLREASQGLRSGLQAWCRPRQPIQIGQRDRAKRSRALALTSTACAIGTACAPSRTDVVSALPLSAAFHAYGSCAAAWRRREVAILCAHLARSDGSDLELAGRLDERHEVDRDPVVGNGPKLESVEQAVGAGASAISYPSGGAARRASPATLRSSQRPCSPAPLGSDRSTTRRGACRPTRRRRWRRPSRCRRATRI